MKRRKAKTFEQQEFFDSMAGKHKRVKKAPTVKKPLVYEPLSKEQYLKNCMWWLQEYFSGRCNKARFYEIIASIIAYADEPQPLLKDNILNYY